MSSELAEWLRINTIWSVLRSDVSWGTLGYEGSQQGQHGPKRCQGEQRRERGWGGRADGRDGHQHGIWGRDTRAVDQATERGEKCGRSNRTGRLSPQLPDKVRSVSLSFVPWLIYFSPFLRSVLMSWVLSNVGDFLAFHFIRDGLRCALHFSGVIGRRYSVSFWPSSPHLHALTRYAAPPTGAPRGVARTTRSTDTWFLSSILSPSSPVCHLSLSQKLSLTPAPLVQSFAL